MAMGFAMSRDSSITELSTESMPDDALAAILLRVPPHPACLARACVAYKCLRRVITQPGFLCAFQELHHNAPPLLGFFHDDVGLPSNFIPTGDSPDRVSAAAFDPKDLGWHVIDSRHGRVLLRSPDRLHFLIWEPMAGRRQYIDAPPPQHADHYKFTNAALVCTAAGQDNHSNYHDCPLSVLCVVTPHQQAGKMVYLYSTEQGSWNEVASGDFSPLMVTERPVVLLGNNVVYWTMAAVMGFQEGILAFELGTHRLHVIETPDYMLDADHEHVQVMEAEDGMLGLVVACGSVLQLWVLHENNGNKGRKRWVMDREIYLNEELAPQEPTIFDDDDDYYDIWLLGMNGDVVFLRTEAGIFEVDLQTEEAKRLCDGYEIQLSILTKASIVKVRELKMEVMNRTMWRTSLSYASVRVSLVAHFGPKVKEIFVLEIVLYERKVHTSVSKGGNFWGQFEEENAA